jgi:acetyl-CoA synthetase
MISSTSQHPFPSINPISSESRIGIESHPFEHTQFNSLSQWDSEYHKSCNVTGDYWEKKGRDTLVWEVPFQETFWKTDRHFGWFKGGKLNASVQCLDKHLSNKSQQVALEWVGEDLSTVSLTYYELTQAVDHFSNHLEKMGLKEGDRVAIYLPMIPETVIAMLACVRLGLVHTVVFGGFAPTALASRMEDCEAKALISTPWALRKGSWNPVFASIEEILPQIKCITNVILIENNRQPLPKTTEFNGKIFRWNLIDAKNHKIKPPKSFDSEHPLFILYTSGTTGKPKGLLHTTAGYLLGAQVSCQTVFDLQPQTKYWCTADVGWITGHTYVVFGPLACGASVFIYEGTPQYPDAGRVWELIDKFKIQVFYTAPTALRSLIKQGDVWPSRFQLTSLRILGSVGEPINPAAWQWYFQTIGKNRCPIVDTWWQTETGCAMLSPIPGLTPLKPGCAMIPLQGVDPQVLDSQGKPCERGQTGFLVLNRPVPSMARTIWGDHERYLDTYWTRYPGRYFTGDAARQDLDGHFWILGRVDDVLNVSGHRLGTMELESALVSYPGVAEAAVIGIPCETKGQKIVAFVILKGGTDIDAVTPESLKDHVSQQISPIARPELIFFPDSLPKTRSGKIMRRLLKELASTGTFQGDVSTLEDAKTLEDLKSQM